MKITNLGIYYLNIETQINSNTVNIIINPFNKFKNIKKTPITKGDVVIITNPTNEHCNNIDVVKPKDKKLIVINKPGEYDVSNSYIQVTEIDNNSESYLVSIDVERIKIGLIGMSKNISSTEKRIDFFNGIDIMFVPVGGGDVFAPEEAFKIINQIEPRIVIPVAYKSKGIISYPHAKNYAEDFIKHIGEKNTEITDKLKIKEENLPQSETKAVILKSKNKE